MEKTLQSRDSVFLQSKEQLGLLFSIIKEMSPSKTKVRQVCSLPIIKDQVP